jgi:hypothetical protein
MTALDLVGASTTGDARNGGSVFTNTSVLSADGGFVTFTSNASNLLAGDTAAALLVRLRNRRQTD